MSDRPANKVLLIGWDAADWQVINPLLEAGQMPTLQSLIEGGVMGNISTLRPMLSPMLWNSIATGKRATKHGIHGFIEPRADGGGIQAVSSTSRKVKALWNICSQNGLRSNVVGWYASHPAEPINGACVSHLFSHADEQAAELPPVPAQSVHPPELADRLADLRVRPKQIGPYHILPFVPSLGEIPTAETPPITGMQKMLARCATTHAVITDLIESQPWDFAAVYYEAIDHFSHAFMKYHPPRMDHIDPVKFERYKACVSGIYRFHDMMLERLAQLAGPDATVIIVSDHGFLNDHLRPVEKDGRVAGPEAWHRHHGMFVMKGPGILKDERVYGATLLDVAPTVLTLLGLPVGADMDGKVLAQCFERTPRIERIDSWETTSGPHDPGLHPPEMQVDPFQQAQALQQLVELGYIAKPDDNAQRAVEMARVESQFNLAAAHLDAEAPQEAAAILESLHAAQPQEPRFRGLLASTYVTMGRLDDARRVLQPLTDQKQRTPQVNVMLGTLAFAGGDTQSALKFLSEAERVDPRLPSLHISIGQVYLKQRRWADAERAFRKASEIDPDSANAFMGLGVAALHQQRHEEAAELLLRSVGLQHYMPRAHFMLGLALTKLGWHDRAVRAFETAVRLRPSMHAAHRFLAALYMKLGDPQRAMLHRERARALTEPFATTR